MRLYPRHRIDISLADLAYGLTAAARRPDPLRAASALEEIVDGGGEVMAVQSVRSGFDLLLSALDLAPSSEVMLSALTISDMARVVRAHGLVPVPVDLDPTTLSPTEEALERAWSAKARVLVVARLFGGGVDEGTAARFAASRGLLLVDDSAQGYAGPQSLRGSPAPLVFHSFGTIKTATCLGGGLVRVKDTALRERMRELHARWPVQPTGRYAKKLALYTAMLVPRAPRVYGAFAVGCERFSSGLDAVVSSMSRGFPATDMDAWLASVRQRPCGALSSLLQRRLGRFDAERLAARALAGETLRERLGPEVTVLGQAQQARTHWVFAVLVPKPHVLIASLRASGFDATVGTTSTAALPAPEERPGLAPVAASSAVERMVFLPVYPEVPLEERERLAALVRAHS